MSSTIPVTSGSLKCAFARDTIQPLILPGLGNLIVNAQIIALILKPILRLELSMESFPHVLALIRPGL